MFLRFISINLWAFCGFVIRPIWQERALFCCKYFNWRSDKFLLGNIDLCNAFFVEFADKLLSFEDFNNACSLFEVLCIT